MKGPMSDRPLNATAASLPRFLYAGPSSGCDLVTVVFGLTYERAVLDWFDRLPAAITAPNVISPGRA